MMESFSGGASLAFSVNSESDVIPDPPVGPVNQTSIDGAGITFDSEPVTFGEL